MDKLKYWGEVDTVEDYLRLIKKLDIGITLKADMVRQDRSKTLYPKKPKSCSGCQFLCSRGKHSPDAYCSLGFRLECEKLYNAKPSDICLPCKSNNNTLSYEENGIETIEKLRGKINHEWK